MNRLLTFLILCCFQFGFSQYNEDWEPAEIYLKDGSVLKGQARITMLDRATPFGQKERLRFTEGKKKPIKEIKAKNVDSIVFELSGRVKKNSVNGKRKATFVVIPKNSKKTKLGFAELVVDGELKLLKRKVSNGNGYSLNVVEETLFQQYDNVPVEFNYVELQSFRNRAMAYFQDCQSLVKKIESKVYKRKDLEAIVKYYNSNCAK
ncbi:hypothetical protein [Hanstruepera marina]|uniref:hypothetical protein n=1 Tax=Hanstruepera marina TaxID=2873265 RepID=UPI001CA70E1C|nr:hypothetical protein [Hanstruepera marina]